MATISEADAREAIQRLGELASAEAAQLDLLLLGGGVMVLAFGERQSTRDLDVVFLPPTDPALARRLAAVVAAERGWPTDWLNDAAKGFLVGEGEPAELLVCSGVRVLRPPIEQLLAMKLCAWRDDVDISDARRLLAELSGAYDELWRRVEPFLQPGRELKARYAFDDLWEATHGTT